MRQLAIVLALVVLVAAIAVILLPRPPAIEVGAATTPIARIVLSGPISPDATERPISTGDVDPGDGVPSSPRGGECLDRIVRADGWIDLCWQAARYDNEMDPAKDYYLLKLYGSYEGVRWMVVGSQLLVEPSGGSYATWPEGTYDGACRQEPIHLFLPMPPMAREIVCGHTEATASDGAEWSQRLVWRCEGCQVPDSTTRGFASFNAVGVPSGSIPSWDLFAEAGR
jgi:hypothetical protein